MSPFMRQRAAFLLVFSTLGCLEGDPNPYDQTTPTGGSGPVTIAPGNTCSQRSGVPVTLTLNNRSARQLRVLWVDYTCVEQPMRALEPGQSFTTSTEAQSPWRLRDLATNALVFEYTTSSTPLQSIDVNVQ